ncbi:MAG: polyprenyl synthetase family protein [Sphingobacteriales bacterium]|nr:polyprenyl synthetase family protein [Sphingobacteriales bacterium]
MFALDMSIISISAADRLTALQQIFEAYFRQQSFVREPLHLYQPIDYMLGLDAKRVRPLACLIAAADEPLPPPTLPAALAIELFHNFTLLHDDIMDKSDLRRGQPTVFKQYGTNTAILSGDALLVLAYTYLQQSAEHLLPVLLKIFNKAALEVCEGQQLDMDFETQNLISEAAYLRMIELKTAVLLAASFEIGAYCGGATATQAKHWYNFGLNLGIAFQIQDDYLDSYGDAKNFGKPIGGDILNNKKTLLFIKACENATPAQLQKILQLYSTGGNEPAAPEKIEQVKNLYRQTEADTACRHYYEQYHRQAAQALEALQLPSRHLELAQLLMERLLHRQK